MDRAGRFGYKPVPAVFVAIAHVAQLVEQRTENPRVGGSIPPLGTIFLHKNNDLFSDTRCFRSVSNVDVQDLSKAFDCAVY